MTFAIERGEHVALVGPNGSGKTTLLETLLGRREPKTGKLGSATASSPRTSRSTRSSSTSAEPCSRLTQNETGLQRPQAQNLLGRFLFTGWEMHERAGRRALGRRAAQARARARRRLGREPAACSTSRRTTSTSRAARRSKPRSTRSRAPLLLVSHDRALLDAIADRTLALEDGTIRSYDGGWAEYVAARDERAEARRARACEPKKHESAARKRQRRRHRARASSSASSPDIADREAEIADLERQLADDWSNVDVVAAHRRARDEPAERCSRAGSSSSSASGT